MTINWNGRNWRETFDDFDFEGSPVLIVESVMTHDISEYNLKDF